ncbi:hypothetical protein SAMN06296036_12460 [Pseudobacteriovorax antillogorgiicola]|uniref:Uncharacterized protein n=2 Tax=Pseudobacteriovorax antillogorgiicola TaxID=1513793 RepID=A0A1Y6CIV3_9BACT|nr:hypothetical protein EDD56_12460 [Pseudobacteriovorax antillogorgiicola]SMF68747.1 hypothetical protein SAMN06296036_12460 [Pseudobacteriovorax antillogorgiicola]
MAKGRRIEWQSKNIDHTKKLIKTHLDHVTNEQGTRGRFEAIMRGIREREASSDPKDLLELYVYIMSALVHHKNWGGLSQQQIKKMVTLAYSILQMQDIQPETSTLGFLYGELHMALSQIYRTSGEHFSGAWEQQVSHHVSKKNPPGGESYQALAKAIRAFRLGQVARAYREYLSVETAEISRSQKESAMIGRIRCLRLDQRFDEAKELITQIESGAERSTKFSRELTWEAFCIKASLEQDLEPMIQSVQRKGSHYQAVYIMEAYLWSLAWPQRQWLDRLPKMSTIARNKKLQAKDLGFFMKAVLCLEECLDSSIPLVIRIKALGQMLKDSNQFIAIDRELLFFIASARWLAKSHSPTLAAIVLGEYEGLSSKISRGACLDVLQVADDLLQRNWYLHGESSGD